MKAEIHIPPSSDVDGYGSGWPSTADVYLRSGDDFVQAGWYVGSNGSGLTNVSTPHFFWGEYDSSAPLGEQTHTGKALAWNSHYTFEVDETSSGTYTFYVVSSGTATKEGTTNHTHKTAMPAAFTGEIDRSCTTMWGVADGSPEPTPTLKYCTTMNLGSCALFDDEYFTVDKGGVVGSESDGAQATVFAFGGS